MKLLQAFKFSKLVKNFRKLRTSTKRALLLGTITIAWFAIVMPFIDRFNVQQPAIQTISDISEINNPIQTTLDASENVNSISLEKAPGQTKPKLSVKDFILPLSGKQQRGTSNELIWWEVLGDYRLHPGVDVNAPQDSSVKAAASGTISEIGVDPLYGSVLVIDHGEGWKTVYGQLQNTKVKLNSKVNQGQEIARVGVPSGGESDLETHLHYELRQNENIVNGRVSSE